MIEFNNRIESDIRFLCRITSDLAGELAALTGVAHEAVQISRDREKFAGVILHFSGRPVAAMGFAARAEGTLTISEPVFLQIHPTDARQQWTCWLLHVVIQEAETTGCRTLRCVQPVDTAASESWMTRTLTESGFVKQARTVVLEKCASEVHEHKTIREQETDDGPGRLAQRGSSVVTEVLKATQWSGNADSEVMLRSVLQHILAESMDLQRLPVPEVEDLLEDWRSPQATIVFVRQRGQTVGLCSFVTDMEQASDGSATTMVLIQYIGVLPGFRRTGIASNLIESLPGFLSGDYQPECLTMMRLKVFCDTENHPARSLYASCGFEESGELDVWYRSCDSARQSVNESVPPCRLP